VEQMNWARANFEKLSVNEITTSIKSVFELRSEFDLEYVEIADSVTLQEVNDVTETARIFIATHIEGVRLIDNMALN
jgi:pantothenate synthetase